MLQIFTCLYNDLLSQKYKNLHLLYERFLLPSIWDKTRYFSFFIMDECISDMIDSRCDIRNNCVVTQIYLHLDTEDCNVFGEVLTVRLFVTFNPVLNIRLVKKGSQDQFK